MLVRQISEILVQDGHDYAVRGHQLLQLSAKSLKYTAEVQIRADDAADLGKYRPELRLLQRLGPELGVRHCSRDLRRNLSR